MQVGNEALVLSAVGVIGLGCQWLAWRLRLPAILFFAVGWPHRRAIYAMAQTR